MTLSEKAKALPARPGVYLFKDARGTVLYVGKARSLRDRVKSYFIPGRDDRAQIRFLLRHTADIDAIVTDTEKEALLLENTLIKEHRPRYNVNLRDDKSYLSIRIGAEHPFPGISLTRRIRKDGALYFGPYDSAAAAREAVEAIARFFRVRSCTDTEFANRIRPCLKFDIGRCTAPCVGRTSREDYAAQVDEASMFLKGQRTELIRRLQARMREASASLQYEEAARLRDAVATLKGIIERQKVVRHGGGDHDAVGVAREGRAAAVCVLAVRGGALLSKRVWHLPEAAGDPAAMIEEFLLARYREAAEIPPVILCSHRPEAMGTIAAIMNDRRGARVSLRVPSKGELCRLAALAATNAHEAIAERLKSPSLSETLWRLGERLGLGRATDVIECLDISNLSGREAVGSLVTFAGGEPDKARYRIYNIRTLSTPDDYGMMREVLLRRFGAEGGGRRHERARLHRPLPDLLLVDGGKGQLSIAKRVLDEMRLPIAVAAIAKAHPPRQRPARHAGEAGGADQIFIPNRKNPLPLKRGSKELLFLMRIRDEAHRFGIGAHRRRRIKQSLSR